MVSSTDPFLDHTIVPFRLRDMGLRGTEIHSDAVVVVLEVWVNLLEFIVAIDSRNEKSIAVVEAKLLVKDIK